MRSLIGSDPAALAVTLALGTVGGVVAQALHLPLGHLLGSLAVTGFLAVSGLRPLGQSVTMPAPLRMCFVPVIGVAIGGAFTPEVVGQAPGWWPSLVALCLFVPLAHALAFAIYRKGGIDRQTAFYGAAPGGLMETVQLGEEAGADVALLTVLQFLRLIGTIIAVPLIFWGMTGHAVGSASGVQMVGSGAALGLLDVAILTGAGLLGVGVGRVLRLPGRIITGPILLSSAAHALGWVEGVPPGWLIAVTQIVVGTGLGARFAGAPVAVLRRGAVLAAVNGLAALGIALGFALVLHALVDEPVAAVFLAFAPGGLAEMSLIALSLNMSVIYVTAHHVARIVLAVALAGAGRRLLP
ncbi:AbrB family transcriptional regulator [Tabrizicola caldifontis]|uniref:AbrB family transcriptional regulator n=1 Tax=Tabrizicola caldifontis TaxID=2528036 RepID=UPI001F0F85B8|nr:AbrB family transcriptional regulator [Rhodobacter sp. YIM 73028]